MITAEGNTIPIFATGLRSKAAIPIDKATKIGG